MTGCDITMPAGLWGLAIEPGPEFCHNCAQAGVEQGQGITGGILIDDELIAAAQLGIGT